MIQDIYCVVNKTTGKLVGNLTNPKKMYWQHKDARDKAITKPNRNWHLYNRQIAKEDLEPLDCVLITQEEYKELKEKAWKYDQLCE